MSIMNQVVALIATSVIAVTPVSAETAASDSTPSRPSADGAGLSTMAPPAEQRESKSEPEASRNKPEARVHARIDWKSPVKIQRTEPPQK